MIVIETSALVAIIQSEPEHAVFAQVVAEAAGRHLPASCYVEAVMVLYKRAGGRSLLERFLRDFDVEIFGSDPTQARIAADAFERFGRGSGHLAKLNFGDCLAYAAAVALGAPLLFKGEDFARTDVRSALAM